MGEKVSANILTADTTGAHLTGVLGQGVIIYAVSKTLKRDVKYVQS